MKTLALIGPTASGKSALAEELSEKFNAVILSLDSLSVYKNIDIASAKPTKESLEKYCYFGVNVLEVNEPFNVMKFKECYDEALTFAQKNNKNLIIVGGTGFYLKTLIEGISPTPSITIRATQEAQALIQKGEGHKFLQTIDALWSQKIEPGDTYRLTKALELYFATDMPPSRYFSENPPKGGIGSIPIFEIVWERDILRNRITLRTEQMIKEGLIDEIAFLEQKFGRSPSPMKAIGITEVLDFFDGKVEKNKLVELISVHTAQLAKRQRTYNTSAFLERISAPLDELREKIFTFNF